MKITRDNILKNIGSFDNPTHIEQIRKNVGVQGYGYGLSALLELLDWRVWKFYCVFFSLMWKGMIKETDKGSFFFYKV